MTNMYRVVNAQANCKDNVDTGDDVNCDAPEMKESNNICQSADYNDDDHNTDLNVA